MATIMQQLDEVVERLDSLEVGHCPHRGQPNHHPIEEGGLEDGSAINPFAEYQLRERGRGAMSNNHASRHWETGMKIGIP